MSTTITRPGGLAALAVVVLLAAGALGCKEQDKAAQPENKVVTVTAEDDKEQAKASAKADKAEGWGTIKGKVTYKDKAKLPDNPEVNVTGTDKDFCLMGGKIRRDEWVVDAKTRGIKNVIVWLSSADPDEAQKQDWPEKLIHPDLKKVPKTLVVDQPSCAFMPRIIVLREGTELIFKNSAKVPHNVRIDGGDLGPKINTAIPPGKELPGVEVKARFLPLPYDCTIHTWMKGWLISFRHPYYAVTDKDGNFEIKNAPAGKYRLQVWHEGYGFVQKNKNDRGVEIEIKDKKTTDLSEEPRLKLIQEED